MNKQTFQSAHKLYHYTSFNSAIKIIETQKIRFGRLENMNDINEAYRRFFYEFDCEIADIDVQKALQEYQQVSFTKDKTSSPGYSISAMWGHYGNKGYGVCLVFDFDIIQDIIKSDKSIWYNTMEYSNHFNGDICIEGNNVHQFFKKHKQELFFTKTTDWEYEQEWRMLKRVNDTNNYYQNIENSIIGIILYASESCRSNERIFDSPEAHILCKLAPNVPLLEYGRWLGDVVLKDKENNDWADNGIYTLDV